MNFKTLHCQYSKKGCQKIAKFQHFIKIGGTKLDKGFICLNCKEFLENLRKNNN